MKKVSTVEGQRSIKISEQKLTVGLDLGDRSSWYCVLDEAGSIVSEQKLGTTPKAMREVFGAMPRCRIALETGMHSPWVSRLLSELRHEVIVAHARNVRLIGESRKKDDRRDAQMLRRWGLKLAERGGKSGKKRALIATARKLAVVLHHLWVSGEVYEPLHNSQSSRLAVAS